MEIGKINGNITGATIDNARNKVNDSTFDMHLKNAMNKGNDQELKKVCKEFEEIILNMMYKQMKASIPKSELLQDDPAKDIFDSMLDEKLMGEASKSGGAGLGDMLYKQLEKRLKSTYTSDK